MDRSLDDDQRAGTHVDEAQQRIGGLAGAAVAARRADRNGDRFVVEQETRDVDVVHGRIGQSHIASEMWGRGRIAVPALKDEGAPIAPDSIVSFIALYCGSKRRMNPTCTSRRPKATSASIIAEQSGAVVASGFSQNTGFAGLDRRQHVVLGVEWPC